MGKTWRKVADDEQSLAHFHRQRRRQQETEDRRNKKAERLLENEKIPTPKPR